MTTSYNDTHSCASRATTKAPNHPRSNFLMLSREIRDIIYQHALSASSPLIAFKGRSVDYTNCDFIRDTSYEAPNDDDIVTIAEFRARSTSVQLLAPNLIRSHSIISSEAALVFYKRNTFRFLDEYSFDDVVNWLEQIGPRNTGYLTALEFSCGAPPHCWQKEDGTRVEAPDQISENERERLFKRSPYLALDPRLDFEGRRGIVENLNWEAIETMFQLLGRRFFSGNLTISMLLDRNYTPGAQLFIDDQHPYGSWFSLDLPNLMEKCRIVYSSKVPGDRDSCTVQILWKANLGGSLFQDGRVRLEELGWEIMSSETHLHDIEYGNYNEGWTDTYFTMRLGRLLEPLYASEPSPHSWIGH